MNSVKFNNDGTYSFIKSSKGRSFKFAIKQQPVNPIKEVSEKVASKVKYDDYSPPNIITGVSS